jgi:hypothetical protein
MADINPYGPSWGEGERERLWKRMAEIWLAHSE